MVRNWNGLSRKVVDALSLKVFKARLEGALAQPKLVPDLVVGNPAMAVELELDDL